MLKKETAEAEVRFNLFENPKVDLENMDLDQLIGSPSAANQARPKSKRLGERVTSDVLPTRAR